jgi:hypothetical protein
MLHAAAAVRRDDAEVFFIRFEQARDEVAVALFQMAQHAHFVFKTPLRVQAVIGFENAPIKTQMDGRAERVFDL